MNVWMCRTYAVCRHVVSRLVFSKTSGSTRSTTYSSFYGRVHPHTVIRVYDLLGRAGGVTAVACRGKVPPSPPLALSDQLPPRRKCQDREQIRKLQNEATRLSNISQRTTN